MLHSLVLLAFLATLTGLAVARPMAGVIAFECFSFMNPQQETWGITGHLPVALIAALATFAGCVFAREPKKLPVNSMTILVLCFLVQITISTAAALGPSSIVVPFYVARVKELSFLLLVAALLTDRRRVHALIWIMVITIGYFGVKGGIFTLVSGGRDHVYGPPNSMIADNNQLAVALLTVLPLMNYVRLQSAHRIVRIGLVGAMMLTTVAVVGTYSRGGLLALFAMSAFLWWHSKGRLRSGVLIAAGLVIAISIMPGQWIARMDTIQHFHQSNSANDRLTVWRQAFGIAMARPLTGAGFAATAIPSVIHHFYPNARQRATHSIWFALLAEGGFPLLFIFIAMNVVSVINLRRTRQRTRGDPDLRWIDDLCRMLEVSMIAFLVGGTFLSLAYYSLYYTVLIVIATVTSMAARARVARGATIRRGPAAPALGQGPVASWRLRGSGP